MIATAVTPSQANAKLSDALRRRGIEVSACFQCGRCSAGCPVSPYFDLLPMEVVRLSAYGIEGPLVSSHTIWLCASCETCSTRCPNGIDIAGLMDALREWTLEKGYVPSEPRVPVFHEAFLRSVRRWGRTYELGMLGAYKLRSGDLFGDLELGRAMFLKGKIHLLPRPIRDRQTVRKLFRGKAERKGR